jgi:hypothetical protein
MNLLAEQRLAYLPERHGTILVGVQHPAEGFAPLLDYLPQRARRLNAARGQEV